MVKNIYIILATITLLQADTKPTYEMLKSQCLSCHKTQSIPSEMIYRKYLLKYSSREIIKEKMFDYLKNPSIENSIMPSQFFSKFPIKDIYIQNDKLLRERVEDYINYYDISTRLFVP